MQWSFTIVSNFGAVITRWSVPWSCHPGVAGLSPGCVSEGIKQLANLLSKFWHVFCCFIFLEPFLSWFSLVNLSPDLKIQTDSVFLSFFFLRKQKLSEKNCASFLKQLASWICVGCRDTALSFQMIFNLPYPHWAIKRCPSFALFEVLSSRCVRRILWGDDAEQLEQAPLNLITFLPGGLPKCDALQLRKFAEDRKLNAAVAQWDTPPALELNTMNGCVWSLFVRLSTATWFSPCLLVFCPLQVTHARAFLLLIQPKWGKKGSASRVSEQTQSFHRLFKLI